MGEDTYVKQILNHIISIKQDIGGLNQSYIDLNSQVKINTNSIEKNRTSITRNDIVMSKWLGGVSVLAILFNVALYYFFN